MPKQLHADGDVLVLSGVVDFESVPELVQLAGSLPATPFSVVDASGVERIDSSGVAFLVWLKKHHGARNLGLTLRNAPAQLSRLLAITGLAEVLESGAPGSPENGADSTTQAKL